MVDAAFWGLIQGLTEFLPISSSGHLVLVPALLGREGPDLATSAVLHLGTLLAVLAYFRRDVVGMLRFGRDGRNLLKLLVIGTIPAAVVGLTAGDAIDSALSDPRIVSGSLVVTGIVLLAARRFSIRTRSVEEATTRDAMAVGLAQAIALVPGISRSGMTITAGVGRRLQSTEAARYSFLLGIPAIAGAGLLKFADLLDRGEGIPGSLWVGLGVAAVSGYVAIAVLLRLLSRIGLGPFGLYCVAAGVISFAIVV
jgi:undecaprenyl-diphosphatase